MKVLLAVLMTIFLGLGTANSLFANCGTCDKGDKKVETPTSAVVSRPEVITLAQTVIKSPVVQTPQTAFPQPGQETSIDLGGGVKMDFVWVEALKIWGGKYEVTNGEYRRFKADHNSKDYNGNTLNGDRQPVVYVNFNDAKNFVEWINSNVKLPEGFKVRLPAETEWMMFAQCGDGRKYPWGKDGPPPNDWNYHGQEGAGTGGKIAGHNDGFPVTCSVEKSGKNDWGLYGVGGNVWEMAAMDATGAAFAAWRGASWDRNELGLMRCSYRGAHGGSLRIDRGGFRLVLSR